MSALIQLEPLEQDERAYLQRRYADESRLFMRAMNVFLVICAFAPLLVALVFYIRSGETGVLVQVYFTGLGFLLLFFLLVAALTYRYRLYALHRDIKGGCKVIEKTQVTETRYMPQTNTWHFYLLSPVKYSIEVQESDTQRWQIGDEINIEYSPHAREYFGYY